MKTINRKPLFLALAGVTALGAVSTAQAIGVSPTLLGDALIYPYYTVKGSGSTAYNTLLSIVNTTGSTKAVKIRFREGKASAEVLDFNIFLSPYDMWVAELDASATGGVQLFTNDKTCTIPRVVSGVEFRNTQYTGDQAKDNSLQRLREGYFEVIEMATYTSGSTIGINSKHNNGVPKDCTKVTNDVAADEAQPPTGGLSGTVSLVSPGSGLNAAADAVAMFGCNISDYFFSNADEPTFANCEEWSLTPTAEGNTIHALWGFGQGQDATSAALMKNAIINEFVLDVATASATDWVVTFPTKHHYVDNFSTVPPGKLFQSRLTSSGSCDDILVNTWDREERTKTPDQDDFSPTQQTPNVQICWEANIVSFNDHNIFNSSQVLGIATLFENGWARIDFVPKVNQFLIANNAQRIEQNSLGVPFVSIAGTTFHGLPVIGFAVETFRPLGTTSYAGVFTHRFVPGSPDDITHQPPIDQ